MQIVVRIAIIFFVAFFVAAALELNSAIYAGLATFLFGCYLSILTDNIRETIFKARR